MVPSQVLFVTSSEPTFSLSMANGVHRIYNTSLLWRHNGHDGVSNHQPHDCLLNCLFRHRSKKTSKLRVTGLCAVNSPGTGEFKWPVTRKTIPFDDVIIIMTLYAMTWRYDTFSITSPWWGPVSRSFDVFKWRIRDLYHSALSLYRDVMTWESFPHYWPSVRGIHCWSIFSQTLPIHSAENVPSRPIWVPFESTNSDVYLAFTTAAVQAILFFLTAPDYIHISIYIYIYIS